MSPLELISSHLMPVNQEQSKACGAVHLDTSGIPASKLVSCAGNAMNLPCVGAVVLACIMSFEKA